MHAVMHGFVTFENIEWMRRGVSIVMNVMYVFIVMSYYKVAALLQVNGIDINRII